MKSELEAFCIQVHEGFVEIRSIRKFAEAAFQLSAFSEFASWNALPSADLLKVRRGCRDDSQVIEGDRPLLQSKIAPGHQSTFRRNPGPAGEKRK